MLGKSQKGETECAVQGKGTVSAQRERERVPLPWCRVSSSLLIASLTLTGEVALPFVRAVCGGVTGEVSWLLGRLQAGCTMYRVCGTYMMNDDAHC